MEGQASSLCPTLWQKQSWTGGSRQQEWGVSSKHHLRGKTPCSGRVWGRAPSRRGDITHQSSHPPALHLLARPPLLRPPLLRSRWVHQLLPGIWGRNRQTDSSPCSGGGGVEGEKSASRWDGGPEPSCPLRPRLAPEDLVAAVAAALPLTAV